MNTVSCSNKSVIPFMLFGEDRLGEIGLLIGDFDFESLDLDNDLFMLFFEDFGDSVITIFCL